MHWAFLNRHLSAIENWLPPCQENDPILRWTWTLYQLNQRIGTSSVKFYIATLKTLRFVSLTRDIKVGKTVGQQATVKAEHNLEKALSGWCRDSSLLLTFKRKYPRMCATVQNWRLLSFLRAEGCCINVKKNKHWFCFYITSIGFGNKVNTWDFAISNQMCKHLPATELYYRLQQAK